MIVFSREFKILLLYIGFNDRQRPFKSLPGCLKRSKINLISVETMAARPTTPATEVKRIVVT